MTDTPETLTIGARFCGPPNSGNGGWMAGALASLVDGPAGTMLRMPPPLDEPMQVRRCVDGSVEAVLADAIVASATTRTPLVIDDIPRVDPTELPMATERYLARASEHPFPTCFVCGPDRAEGDGLRIFPGPVDGGRGGVAAAWTPDASLADAEGRVQARAVWAALDCPGGMAPHMHGGLTCVLGRHAVQQLADVRAGDTYAVVGWPGERDGRKLPSRTALVDLDDGTPLAVGESTWIEVDPADFT